MRHTLVGAHMWATVLIRMTRDKIIACHNMMEHARRTQIGALCSLVFGLFAADASVCVEVNTRHACFIRACLHCLVNDAQSSFVLSCLERVLAANVRNHLRVFCDRARVILDVRLLPSPPREV